MSTINSKGIHDASNSWNGYNHQGKVAILLAIKKILEVYEETLNLEENKTILDEYFIEIEYFEDFSLGKITGGKTEYFCVNQVKNKQSDDLSVYEEPLYLLTCHVIDRPSLCNVYLHTTTEIDFKGKAILDYIKDLYSYPPELRKTENEIQRIRKAGPDGKKMLAEIKGKKEFTDSLKKALNVLVIDETNIAKALSALETETQNKKAGITPLTNDQAKKVNVYTYDVSGKKQQYCEADQIEDLIKNEIVNFLDKSSIHPEWREERFIDNRYLFLLGQLDKHIIDRNLHYDDYKNDRRDRKIRLSVVLDWLTSDDIDTADEHFYQYRFKNDFSVFLSEFCQHCKEKGCDRCDVCLIEQASIKIRTMDYDEMCKFLILTNPRNSEGLSTTTLNKFYTRDYLGNPMFRGLRDIRIPFQEDKTAITYLKGSLQYILTTLNTNDDFDDSTRVCTDITKNACLYDLLMDNDWFISNNIDCPSILEGAIKINETEKMDQKQKEHIARVRDAGIIKLSDFLNK